MRFVFVNDLQPDGGREISLPSFRIWRDLLLCDPKFRRRSTESLLRFPIENFFGFFRRSGLAVEGKNGSAGRIARKGYRPSLLPQESRHLRNLFQTGGKLVVVDDIRLKKAGRDKTWREFDRACLFYRIAAASTRKSDGGHERTFNSQRRVRIIGLCKR